MQKGCKQIKNICWEFNRRDSALPQVSAFKSTVFQCCYPGLVFVSLGRELWELLLPGAVAGGLSGKTATCYC